MTPRINSWHRAKRLARRIAAAIILTVVGSLAQAQTPPCPPMLPAVPCLMAGAQSPIATTDQAEVCAIVDGLSYSKRHRSGTVEASLHCPRGWQADHRIPLGIGGADAVENLWCQPYPDWKSKDELDTFAWRSVCHGTVPLAEAQAWFLDWRANLWRINGRHQ